MREGDDVDDIPLWAMMSMRQTSIEVESVDWELASSFRCSPSCCNFVADDRLASAGGSGGRYCEVATFVHKQFDVVCNTDLVVISWSVASVVMGHQATAAGPSPSSVGRFDDVEDYDDVDALFNFFVI